MNSKKALWQALDITGLVVGAAAISIGLLDSLEIVDVVPDKWYPVITVLFLSALTIYMVLERRILLSTMEQQISNLSNASRVEIASNRTQAYQQMIESASEGTPANPVRYVKIYAPLGFGRIHGDKLLWLNTLKKLVISRRVTDVVAVYGIPQDGANLAKAANFLMHFFYHTDSGEADALQLRSHVFVRGIMLGGAGLGIPRGFGIVAIEDRVLMIGYAESRGDRQVQKGLIIRNNYAIQDMSDWFDNHVYVGGGLKTLQDFTQGEHVTLYHALKRILEAQEVPPNTIERILSAKLLSDEETSLIL